MPQSGVALIAAERKRQQEVEGWTAKHDDEHDGEELAMAAACYASPELIYAMQRRANTVEFVDPWPWAESWDKREYDGNVLKPNADAPVAARLRQLVKAGALIAAEIDRLQRKKVHRS